MAPEPAPQSPPSPSPPGGEGKGERGLRPILAIRAFQRLGYAVERAGGGHFVLEHPGRPPLQIPYRAIQALVPGFIKAQLRVARLADAEFAAALAESVDSPLSPSGEEG